MGLSVSGNSQGSFTRRGIPTTLAEINVTPLVDVMLVLLIVFMISAPLMQQGAQIDLPKASTGSLDETPDQIVLVVKQNKKITLNDKPIKKGTLRKKLAGIASVKPDVQVYIRADRKLPYGFIAQVIAEVRQAKIFRVGLVTEPGDTKKRL